MVEGLPVQPGVLSRVVTSPGFFFGGQYGTKFFVVGSGFVQVKGKSPGFYIGKIGLNTILDVNAGRSRSGVPAGAAIVIHRHPHRMGNWVGRNSFQRHRNGSGVFNYHRLSIPRITRSQIVQVLSSDGLHQLPAVGQTII